MNKKCPSCQKEVPVAVKTCKFCNWQFRKATKATKAAKPAKPKIKPVRVKNPGTLELAIAIDRTGSSEQFQQGIYTACETIFKQLQAKVANINCWLQSHGDLDYAEIPILHIDAGTAEQVLDAIKSIEFDGGGDPPEHHIDGIQNLLNTVPWTANSTKARAVMICFLTADSKPAKSGITAEQLGAEIKNLGILFYLVCEPTPILVKLVKAASGLMFRISNNPDKQELNGIAQQVGGSITATVGKGDTVAMSEIINK